MATQRQPAVPGAHLIREAEAISAGAVAVFFALSFLSFSPDAPPANLGGPVGQALAGTALRALGVAAYLFPLYLGYFTVALLRRGAEGFGGLRLVGAALLVASIAALAGLVTGGRAVVRGGGWLGGFVGVALGDLLGGPGAFLLGLPTLGAACLHDLVGNLRHGGPSMFQQLGAGSVVLGVAVATVSAVLAVRWLVSFLTRHGLAPFGWYRLALSAAFAALILAGVAG